MEQEGRTVIVCGVPTDIDEKRLTDKLYIHFLRKRHGGGEISSVTQPKSMRGCALITFEDSEVAQRVIQYGKHILMVDDKKFELTVSLFRKEVDPDEVFLCITVTVDYSRLPLGKVVVSSLQQSFPDVHFSFMPQKDICNIKGRYSEVQALITHLLNLIDPQASKTTSQIKDKEDKVDALLLREENSSASGPVYHSKSNERQIDNGYEEQALQQDLKSSDNSERIHHSDQALDENRVEVDFAGSMLQEAPLEEYNLVMDSDIYRYLQHHCREQYQHILSQHKVEAVDLCTQDITTVFLQAKAGHPGQEVKRLHRVHEDLGWLYLQTEAQLRKEQLTMEGISTEGLQEAFKALQQRLPKILLSNDKMNIYIVGSGSDVSEAKQFFLDMQGIEGGSTQGRAGHTRPSFINESGSLFLPSSSSASTLVSSGSEIDAREADTVQKPHRKHKMEAGKEYKLAARFMETAGKNTGNNATELFMGDTAVPGDAQKDLSFATSKKTSYDGRKLGSKPVLGLGSLDIRECSLSDNQGQNQTENDLLFGKPDKHFTTSTAGKYLPNMMPTRAVLPNRPMKFSDMQNTVQNKDLFRNKVAQTAEIPSSGQTTQSKLGRANSFSGKVGSTQHLKDSTTPGASKGKTNRAKTSSFRSSIDDTLEFYSVEVVASLTVWLYMKDYYHTQIENLTAGLYVKESRSGSTVTVCLRGADSSAVRLCQLELQNLIAKVTTDICTQELSLAKLGVTNPKDETLELSCLELQNKFEKIKIVPVNESIIIIGPNQLCGQVVMNLLEVFRSGTQRKTEMEENMDGSSPISLLLESIPQMPTDNMKNPETASGAHNLLSDDLTQTIGLLSLDSSLHSRHTQMSKQLKTSSRRKDGLQGKDYSWKEVKQDFGTEREGGNQSAEERDPEFKHNLGLEWTMSRENIESDKSPTQLTIAGQRLPVPKDSGSTSLPNFAYTFEKAVVPNKESTPNPHNIITLGKSIPPGPDGLASPEVENPKEQDATFSGTIQGKNLTKDDGLSCPCGASGSSMSRMACGNTYCSQCLFDHTSCKVCPKAEDVRGIKGTMSYAEMYMSLPGHVKDTTLKLTYSIPDGIQGDNHPNPGASFKGGVFEAFLPLNRQTRTLVPQLKRAFHEGLTFTITEGLQGGRVAWKSIPHKTKMDGGKSVNGYPDSTYISRLTEALKLLDIKDRDTTKVPDKIKS